MDADALRELLGGVRDGSVPIEDAVARYRDLPFEDLGFAKVDHHRALRNGAPEVILCEGKATEEVVAISEAIVRNGSNLFATRAASEVADAVRVALPDARYNARARTISLPQQAVEAREGILIVSAGTSDLPVAEEAFETASIMGNAVERLYDVGVAGIHRLLSHTPTLAEANVVVVVAGMEGALPSVVGGLVSAPVIAVPTSVGYGASLNGIAALLGMLNSCASGVTVVNIDNGFGAGCAAARINAMTAKAAD
ncbi:nickel pincer cofactor biosynthesis protein LarB [Candidatus Poribacteria bacterium]|jgi:pyridinium-3,5-biscarboxylic acid mononucleotide synthase|nr:nickel pincer cofactor biosynthesis protein LarB [Candidatus Poribacteria bacterium]MBT5533202.1 nickel pincer cofactor biosynthesis protein LarB [Candidatus Poribacteria bacterium]MBT5713885.1 nickel pincer cofactor biosynthesis protein LarB [Candidatus Poribacteria bacterium]MBT7097751.1 nickel pincer cofactor biosynthesis protein LarB [Candidatus Poribacteria bacterium]MBT7808255.1 nickel pincer cofactor biosynthesis protein LarB [Candidatus Poribacteria bacterium]